MAGYTWERLSSFHPETLDGNWIGRISNPVLSLLPEMRVNPTISGLGVYPLFQFITHFEMGELLAGDPNELARFWISPPVGRILLDLEGGKPTDLNAVPFGQSCGHSSKDRLDALFRVNFGNSQRVRK